MRSTWPGLFTMLAALAGTVGSNVGVAAPHCLVPHPGLGEEFPYDEVFDAACEVRAQYKDFYKVYQKMTATDRRRFMKKTFKTDFRKDNRLDPLPRVLTESENAVLREGVEQRGEAPRLFLQDYYGGGTSYQKVIPEDVLQRIIERSGEAGFKGLVKPEMIAFPYGPDIIRTPDGSWAVIEDNPGFIGGRGDLHIARASMLKRQPGYAPAAAKSPDPMKYYESLVQDAVARAKPPGSKIVIYMVPPYADNEDNRLRALFKKYGVETVTPANPTRSIKFDERGAYLEVKNGNRILSRERVGFVFINGEHKWVDPSHPSTRETLMVSEARDFLKAGHVPRAFQAELKAILDAPGRVDLPKLEVAMSRSGIDWNAKLIQDESLTGLMDAIYHGRVATDYAPGVDFVGDKEFYTYVEGLIRHYLHQEPVIANLMTWRLTTTGPNGELQLNEALLKRILSPGEYQTFVSKIVDGRGGDGVWIGKYMKPDELKNLEAKIRDLFRSFIAQKYTALSKVENRIVDLRYISQVTPHGTQVAPVSWGRGLPDSGNGKVNLSDQGREFTTFVVPDPARGPAEAALVKLPGAGSPRCLGRVRALLGWEK